MDSLELRQQANAENALAEEILNKAKEAKRVCTEDERQLVIQHQERAKQYLAQAKLLEDQQTLTAELTRPQARKVTPEIASGERIEVVGAPKLYRAGKLRAFTGPNAAENAYWSGMWLRAALYGHARSRQLCDQRGMHFERESFADSRAMSEGVNTAGGFLVPDAFEQTIIDLREQYGNARRNLRIVPMGSDHSNEPKKTGGLTAHPRGEGQAATESQQGWGNVELTARSWDVLTRMSVELSEDAMISLAEDLATDISMAFAQAEDEACIDGDGSSSYHGIVGIRTKIIDGTHSASVVDAAQTGDNWSEISDDDLMLVMAALPKYAEIGAKWHCSKIARVAVFNRLLRAAGGATMAEISAGAAPSYMGFPIEEWAAMPGTAGLGTGTDLNDKCMILFGNMSMSSKLGNRRGITIQRLGELYATQGQIGIMASERFDINHHSLGSTTVPGPIISLNGTT
jgi:HK97 family phage major capsid protein